MTSKQYEELCRYFAAWLFQIPIDHVHSLDAPNPLRPELSPFAHQIDLCWDLETPAARYLHIANAKWRTPPHPVDQDAVLLLQQVKSQVDAHKAMLMTNFGYTDGAMLAAQDAGVALHLVKPAFDYRRLHPVDPAIIQSQLQSLARMAGRPLCVHELLLKGGQAAAQQQNASEPSPATPLESTGIVRKVFHQQATESSPPSTTGAASDRLFRYQNKQGPPPGMMKK
jgi:hypothetical protein